MRYTRDMRYDPSNHRYIRVGLVWLLCFMIAIVALNYVNRYLETSMGVLVLIAGLGCGYLVYRFQKYVL